MTGFLLSPPMRCVPTFRRPKVGSDMYYPL